MRPDGDSVIRAGALRHLVSIYSNAPSSPPVFTEGGVLITRTALYQNVPAAIDPERATDKIQNGQTTTETLIPITIRWLPGIVGGLEVDFQDNISGPVVTFIVQGVKDVEFRHRLLELECLQLGTGT
jgi:hypothetical protein